MQTISLYRFTRPDGGVTVSPVKPDGDYTELTRLIADEGMVLTDGENYNACVDTDTPENWTEIEDNEMGKDPDEATEADYREALQEMGVKV